VIRPLASVVADTLSAPVISPEDARGNQSKNDRRDVLRQLKRRVPWFDALSSDSQLDLTNDFREFTDNFVFIRGYLRNFFRVRRCGRLSGTHPGLTSSKASSVPTGLATRPTVRQSGAHLKHGGEALFRSDSQGLQPARNEGVRL